MELIQIANKHKKIIINSEFDNMVAGQRLCRKSNA